MKLLGPGVSRCFVCARRHGQCVTIGDPPARYTRPAATMNGNGLGISVSGVKVHAHLLLTLTVRIKCASVGTGSFYYDEVTVSVEQQHGNTVSTASQALYAGGPYGGTDFLTCDGSAVNKFSFRLLPSAGSSPFNVGAAVMTVTAEHSASTGSDSGTLGPRVVQLVARPGS